MTELNTTSKIPGLTPRRSIFFLADGARPDVMEALARAGRLPAIKELFYDKGSSDPAVTVFPSTTGPAYLPFVTGCYPGTCDLPGIRWFDRHHYANKLFSMQRSRSYVGVGGPLLMHDIAKEPKTMFEMIPKSLNVYNHVKRGAGMDRERAPGALPAMILAHLTSDYDVVTRQVFGGLRRALVEDFEFLFVAFPGIDGAGHNSDPFSEWALGEYEKIEQAVEMAYETLSRYGLWETTSLTISADHGMTPTHSHFDLDQFIEKLGHRNYYYPTGYRYWTNATAATMVSGNSMANLYFAHPKGGWNRKPIFEELANGMFGGVVDRLLEQEAVDLVAGPDAEGVRVKTRRGEAWIREEAPEGGAGEARILYRVTHGTDPFGYTSHPAEGTERESLAASYGTEYPDAPVQLLQFFRSKRAGDLVVSAKNGHDLRVRWEFPEHKASHGGFAREHMLVPYLSNRKLEAGPRRTVDYVPTELDYLGRDIPKLMDGRVIPEQVKTEK